MGNRGPGEKPSRTHKERRTGPPRVAGARCDDTGHTDTVREVTGQEETYRPGLDGIRALAVMAVLCFHLDRLPGGNLGVDAFFVVSGWLITWKLLDEGDRTGRIALSRFWTGRIRRLMPASMAVLLTVALVWPLDGMDVPSLRRDLFFAAGWSSNWGTISGGGDYWARFGDPSPITHFWSLAIEEQYYVIWPIVLAVIIHVAERVDRSGVDRGSVGPTRIWRRHRLLTGTMSAVLAGGSIVAMNLMYDAGNPTATYMNTFARAHSLLLGAAAAALTTVLADGGLRGGRAARRIAPVGAATVVALIAAVSIDPEHTAWLYRWGFPVFAGAMVPVVVAAADGGGARLLASPPMRWVADRSYGLYLWHWPVFLLMSPDRFGISDGWLPRALLDLCRVGVAVALADLSFRWLETPVRRRRRLVAWRGPLAAGIAMTTVAVLAVTLVPRSPATSSPAVVTLPPPPLRASTGSSTGASSTGASSTGASSTGASSTGASSTGASSTGASSTGASSTGASSTGAAVGSLPASRSSLPTPSSLPAVASMAPTPLSASVLDAGPADGDPGDGAAALDAELGRPLRVLVTGDSTALHLSEALIAHATAVPDELAVGSGAFPGCGLSAGNDGRMHAFTDTDGTRDLIDLSGCLTQWRSVPERVVAEAVDVVLVEIGPWDAVDIRLLDGTVVSVGDARGRGIVTDAYRAFAERVIAAGARVVWVTPTDTHLGWGDVDDPLNDPVRWQALRAIVDDLSDDFGVVQIDLPAWLDSTGLTGPEGRPDGVHLADGLDERFVANRVAPMLAEQAGILAGPIAP